MTDVAKTETHHDIDEIATSAVEQFCRQARPLREDISRLIDLVLPLIPRLHDSSLRKMASALAIAPFAPNSLLLALCDFPVAICSPILTRCESLNGAELLAIISQYGEDHARAIARRRNLPHPVIEALRTMNSPGVDRALDLRQRVEEEKAAAFDFNTPELFESYRETMHGDLQQHAQTLTAIDFDEMANLAAGPNPGLFHTAMADAIGISLTSAQALCEDPSSKNLIYALRFVGAPADKAYGIFAALAPGLAIQAGVHDRFLAVFASIRVEEAVRKVWSWRSDDLMAIAREALAANDRGSPEEADRIVASVA
jgi:uncharacterized protein (DUF2336 family)